jgi:hypothetical protein
MRDVHGRGGLARCRPVAVELAGKGLEHHVLGPPPAAVAWGSIATSTPSILPRSLTRKRAEPWVLLKSMRQFGGLEKDV